EHFPALRESISSRLNEAGLPPCEEDRLLLRRLVTESGSRCFINGSSVTAAIMRTFGELLIDIHGPNDSHSLLQPSRQLRLLDLYGGHQQLTDACAALWQKTARLQKELDSLHENALTPEDRELLRHQLDEILSAAPDPSEEAPLIARHRIAANGERLRNLARGIAYAISDAENSVCETLAPCIQQAEELLELDPERGGEFLERLNSAAAALNDLAYDLETYGSNDDFDEEALREAEERIGILQRLKRRYGPTLEDVVACARRMENRLNAADTILERQQELLDELKHLRQLFSAKCGELTAARRRAAENLAPAVSGKLHRLGFTQARFEAAISPAAPGSTGADSCEFNFAPNPGEDIAPLRQAASSGEIARVMLAVKTVLSEVDDIPVLVFDEIDANVGGKTAAAVASELRSVGTRHQVFSITHSPLIAAAGDNHFLVEKHLEGDRTVTGMTTLQGEERINELLRMLGADARDAGARAHVLEMMANALN
ncbi:MAG: hypothetical protein J6S21_07440, partial [Victivallales bacterium]|nr:hypothetical protein [Victivallales bacterium]